MRSLCGIPPKSGSKLLREFTRGMFGVQNEEKMARVLEAVETCHFIATPMATDAADKAAIEATDCEHHSDPANRFYTFGCGKLTRQGYENLFCQGAGTFGAYPTGPVPLWKRFRFPPDFVPRFPSNHSA